tara:strand:+ start:2600 stop:3754 length:1155 start_codon:yes stop_codon:yes gene_type:complete
MKKKLKIAFVPSTFIPIIGGAEIQAHNLANMIVKQGHNVDVWNTKISYVENKFYKIFNFNRLFLSLTFILRYYFKININFILEIYISKIINKNKYDVWHFHSLNFKTLIIFEILKKLNQKTIITFQGADIQVNKKINYGYRIDNKYDNLLKKNILKFDKVHSVSKDIDRELLKLNYPKRKILRIPNCINLKKIVNVKKNSKKKFTIITVARYAEKKKGFDFVEKIAYELNKYIDFEWILIGRDIKNILNYKFILNNRKKFKLINQINSTEFYFPSKKLIKYYKSANVYAHLSRIESFGITIIEAIASKIPVVAFKSSGAKNIVENNKNGLFVKCFNIKDYTKNLLKIYSKKSTFNSFNYHKLKNYDLKFNAEKTINDYLNVLKN